MPNTPRLLAIGAVLAGCSAAPAPNTEGNAVDQACRPLTVSTPGQASLESSFQGTVFTLVIENKTHAQMFEGKDAPYFQSLARQGAVARGYTDPGIHPSEPNYLWMVSGQNFGILDDADPAAHHIASTSHLVDQLEKVGKSWKTYQESMGEPCKVVSQGKYAAKHNPFIYFDDVVGWDSSGHAMRQQRCIDHVVDYSQLDVDLAADKVPDYVFITPNLINDMHDGSIAQGDAWLSREVPKILASNAYKNGGVLFILADEGENGSDDPPFLVLSPMVKPGFVSDVPYDTSSFLKTVQAMEGVESLPCGSTDAIGVPTMDDLFTIPMPATGV